MSSAGAAPASGVFDPWSFFDLGTVVTAGIGAFTLAFLCISIFGTKEKMAEINEERPPKKKFPKEQFGSPDRAVTLQWLSNFDGEKNRMYIGVCGKVYDVHDSDNFRPDFGYGKLWGGRDATWALANMSLKTEDVGKLDWSLADLDVAKKTALKSWVDHFEKKYKPALGTLKEYADWDFSVLEEFGKKEEEEENVGEDEKGEEESAGAAGGQA